MRKTRVQAGLSAESAAKLLGVDRGAISNIESGIRAISPERVRTLARACGCRDERYIAALAEMAQPGSRGWWYKYRSSLPPGLLDIAELEANSARMRAAYSVHIPGLLQTENHALAIFRAVLPALPEEEIEARLAHRLTRQRLLDSSRPPAFLAIVHEAALRMQFGGPKVAKAQLQHLLDRSEQNHVTLVIIPFTAGAFPGAGQTVLYAEGPVPALDTVQIDNSHGPDFLHSPKQLAKYRAHLDWMEEIALTPAYSRDLIHDITNSL